VEVKQKLNDDLSTEFRVIEVIFGSLRLTEVKYNRIIISGYASFFLGLAQVFPRGLKTIQESRISSYKDLSY